MSFFKKKEPRIAFEQQRDGTLRYFVEIWGCCEAGCFWRQETRKLESLDEAKEELKKIRDKEIVKRGVII